MTKKSTLKRLIGFTVLVIVSENLLDVTKAHKAGG